MVAVAAEVAADADVADADVVVVVADRHSCVACRRRRDGNDHGDDRRQQSGVAKLWLFRPFCRNLDRKPKLTCNQNMPQLPFQGN